MITKIQSEQKNSNRRVQLGLMGKAMLLTLRALSREAAVLYMAVVGDHTVNLRCTDS